MRVIVVVMMLTTLLGGVMANNPLLFLPALWSGGSGLLPLFAIFALKYFVLTQVHLATGKRSVHDPTLEAEENLLLSTVSQLDGNGCVLKLLCLLETKEAAARTQEEKVMVDVFSNKTDAVTSYNAAFVYAADLGAKTHNSVICDKYFNKCDLSEAQLSGLLQNAWGCGDAV